MIDKVYKLKTLEIAWERVRAPITGLEVLTAKASKRSARGSKSASLDCMRSFEPTVTLPNP